MADTMRKAQSRDVKPYQAPGYFNMTAPRLHAKKETGTQRCCMKLSRFHPHGGAEYDESLLERTYCVLEGEVTITVRRERSFQDPGVLLTLAL